MYIFVLWHLKVFSNSMMTVQIIVVKFVVTDGAVVGMIFLLKISMFVVQATCFVVILIITCSLKRIKTYIQQIKTMLVLKYIGIVNKLSSLVQKYYQV